MSYITPKNALILAISPATQDLANSDALKIAREVDPSGMRTLGVITKLDLMDEGTNALEMLGGSIYKLKLGYYGVKCRSQKQINENVTIREAKAFEKEFFAKHPDYQNATKQLGIDTLTHGLNQTLVNHLKRCIPGLNQ
jgi:dynamin 1-like protein